MKPLLPLVTLLFIAIAGRAQETQNDKNDIGELSLEELMNVPIQSASKKEEKVFDAPLSSTTITRAEIEQAGSTSIMEALRLAPGLIVREQANGVYDIHIRGFDNILRSVDDIFKQNVITLVMIDSRPAFNHNLGGTFWEALPVDINDVERIEIVRGPSAPLFGPNAVSGVINIITRRASGDKPIASAKFSWGLPNTTIANAMMGRKIKKWNITTSFNYQKRDRFSSDYYKSSTGKFVSSQDLSSDFNNLYPSPDQSMNKWGANGTIGYTGSKLELFDVSFGVQNSRTMKNFLGGNNTRLTTNESRSAYVNLSAKISNVNVRTSLIFGNDDLNYGSKPNQYDYRIMSSEIEYSIKLGKKGMVTPGMSLQNVNYNDNDYRQNGTNPNGGYLNGEASITTLAGFVRSDINLSDKWRALVALRADKFSTPDEVYLAYEFATTYKLTENKMVRMAITQSNSGSFVGNNFLNVIQPTPVPGINVTIQGNDKLKLFTMNMIELGYRMMITPKVQIDIDAFRSKLLVLHSITIIGCKKMLCLE